MGDYEFEAVFQGNPTPREGSFFKVDRFGFVDAAPKGYRTVRRWDNAATAGAGDYTVGVKMTGPTDDGQFVVLDVVRGQWDTAERNRIQRLTAEMDGKTVTQIGVQDPGSGGKDAAAAFTRLMAGFPVKIERESGDKELRADPYSSQVSVHRDPAHTSLQFVHNLWKHASGSLEGEGAVECDAKRISRYFKTNRHRSSMPGKKFESRSQLRIPEAIVMAVASFQVHLRERPVTCRQKISKHLGLVRWNHTIVQAMCEVHWCLPF
jgi:phage terminase large subunit-like protein